MFSCYCGTSSQGLMILSLKKSYLRFSCAVFINYWVFPYTFYYFFYTWTCIMNQLSVGIWYLLIASLCLQCYKNKDYKNISINHSVLYQTPSLGALVGVHHCLYSLKLYLLHFQNELKTATSVCCCVNLQRMKTFIHLSIGYLINKYSHITRLWR